MAEKRGKKWYKDLALYQFWRRNSSLYRIRLNRLQRQYAAHADPRRFDWDWQATHFNRIALVNLLVSKFADPAYLEIGCEFDVMFNAVPAASKVGVDPYSGGTERTTSDAFFARNTSRFDVVFIDGLHTYDQVRRDIVNAIPVLNKGGWIALHDMMPRDWIEQHVPVVSGGAWTGDVWKVAFELASTEGIDFRIAKIDYGVGVFRLTRDNVVLNDMFDELRDRQFDYFADNLGKLPVVEWDQARAWIKSAN